MTKKVDRRVKVTLGDLKRARGGVQVESHLKAGDVSLKQKVVEHAIGEMRDPDATVKTAPPP